MKQCIGATTILYGIFIMRFATLLVVALSSFFAVLLSQSLLYGSDEVSMKDMGWEKPLSHEDCWSVLPKPIEGGGQPLPTWARMLAQTMPKTTAAFLELDLAQRTRSPIPPKLRAAMRWMAAHENRSPYAMETAKGDALRAGMSTEQWKSLESLDRVRWSPAEKTALAFASAMTKDSDSVTDEEFERLLQHFDERQVASMVLLLAYANFQDRLLLCLGAPLEESPLPPISVRFPPESLVSQTTPPSKNAAITVPATDNIQGIDIVEDVSPHTWLPYPQLQERLEQQRQRKTRLRIPDWNEFSEKLPKGLMEKPSDIVWYRIAFGYADELAVPFEIYLRTASSEMAGRWDRPFGNCLFWIVTDAVKCPYCMGHCEMNWEVTGLSSTQISDVSRILAGDDWSSFTEPQQKALAFARKLTLTPWEVNRHEMDELREGLGQTQAFYVMLNSSRYNYMTRISNGFQLTLERGNPFWDYYRMDTPKK